MKARAPGQVLNQEALARLTTCPIAELLGELEQLDLVNANDKKLEFKGSRAGLAPEHLMALRRRTSVPPGGGGPPFAAGVGLETA